MPKPNMRQKAAGRVLSAANESRIRDARDALDSVLSKLEDEIAQDNGLLKHMNRVNLKPGHIRINADPQSREAELKIYGDIGGWGDWDEAAITGKSISKQIDGLDVDTLHVRINSGGGLVFEGIAIYNALARHPANIVIHIDSIAASIASVIAMAGDEIRISEGSHIMIHKPWSMAYGDANAMRKEADILDKIETGIIDLYAARTGAKRTDIEDWVGAETWFLGQEAVDAGFADEMVPAKKKKPANSALLNLFKNTPTNLLANSKAPEVREFETFLREGEGLSNAQAKRIASQAARGMDRDDPPKLQVRPLPDVGDESVEKSNVAKRLAKEILQFTSTI